MTMNAKRRRAHDKLAAMPGVRSVRRPVTPGGDDEFDLYYVRTGPATPNPLVVIPGGPGAASVALYRGLRRHAAARGIGAIMIDHRGVGMSRHDDRGVDLPPEALTIDQAVNDVAAVLDDAQVDKAVIYGTSYGTYLAAGVGVRHPDRVHAMVLDSPLLSARDIDAARDATRRVLLDGDEPDAVELAPKIRKLVDDGVMTPVAGQLTAAVYGLAGPAMLTRQLDLLLRGRHGLWTVLDQASKFLLERKMPYRNEPDLVGRIGFRELNYGAVPDGLPLDPAVAFRELAAQTSEFEAEPYDLAAEMPKFSWPTAVVSGGRDLITPRAVAEEIASLIPRSALVGLATAGHSLIDVRERAALDIVEALYDGDVANLPARGKELDAVPPSIGIRLLVGTLGAAAVVESALPAVIPRVVQRVR
ncbi:alpha/beta fold hydrolase [Mycolicibacterium moriokaense]|nr:alpha/beta fold hydrolase [Mycolicibacterium moriokaense]